MKTLKLLVTLLIVSMVATSCGGFKSKRVGGDEGDELASNITDKWLIKDTEMAVKDIKTKSKGTHHFRNI